MSSAQMIGVENCRRQPRAPEAGLL